MFTSTKEVMVLPLFVCVCSCAAVCVFDNITQKVNEGFLLNFVERWVVAERTLK